MTASVRFIRLPEICARIGLKRAAVYQRIKDGRFPKPVLLSKRCACWPEDEVTAWIESQVERRDSAA